MTLSELYPGMAVRVRDWDDMAAEFGTGNRADGEYICTPCFTFICPMKRFCGLEYVIERINEKSSTVGFARQGSSKYDDALVWYFVPEMLEPVIDTAIDPPSDEDFLSMLISVSGGDDHAS